MTRTTTLSANTNDKPWIFTTRFRVKPGHRLAEAQLKLLVPHLLMFLEPGARFLLVSDLGFQTDVDNCSEHENSVATDLGARSPSAMDLAPTANSSTVVETPYTVHAYKGPDYTKSAWSRTNFDLTTKMPHNHPGSFFFHEIATPT